MKLSDTTPADTDSTQTDTNSRHITSSTPDVDCQCPRDANAGKCGVDGPRPTCDCTRRPGHDGPHVHCGKWNCGYVVWTDDEVVYDHHDEILGELQGDGA